MTNEPPQSPLVVKFARDIAHEHVANLACRGGGSGTQYGQNVRRKAPLTRGHTGMGLRAVIDEALTLVSLAVSLTGNGALKSEKPTDIAKISRHAAGIVLN